MTSDLRAALTHALQPLLPPGRVAGAVDTATRLVEQHAAAEVQWSASDIVRVVQGALPEPYRSAAEIAEAIAPLVSAWWRDRVVEVSAGSVTVTEHRT